MEIIRAAELGNDARMKISELFVDGFYQWLKYFSKDKAKLAKAFQYMFNLEVFYNTGGKAWQRQSSRISLMLPHMTLMPWRLPTQIRRLCRYMKNLDLRSFSV